MILGVPKKRQESLPSLSQAELCGPHCRFSQMQCVRSLQVDELQRQLQEATSSHPEPSPETLGVIRF